MRIRLRAVLTAAFATLLLAALTSSVAARNFSFSNQQIRATFRNLEFAVAGLGTDRCDYTLEGTFHSRTIAKVVGTLVGYITRVTTAGCNLTTAILALPWHIRYVGFIGLLPDITSVKVKISRSSFSAGTLGFICLAEPEIEANFNREAGGRITELRTTEIPSMPVRSGGGFGCPAETGRLGGHSATVTLLGTSNDISVTLI